MGTLRLWGTSCIFLSGLYFSASIHAALVMPEDLLPVLTADDEDCILPECVIGWQGTDLAETKIISTPFSALASASLNAGDIFLTVIATNDEDASAATAASATGLAAEGGDDTLRNAASTITTSANSTTVAGNLTITVDDSAHATANITSAAQAVSFEGGAGDDDITNSGQTDTFADASSGYGDFTLTLLNNAFEGSVNAMLEATATATGISGDDGNDTVKNLAGEVKADASAIAASGALTGSVFGNGVADTGLKAQATATGIAGGAGMDTVNNWATVTAKAYASVGAGQLTVEVVEGFGTAKLDRESVAVATGIDGGDDDDTLLNGLKITSTATAVAAINDVTIAPVFIEAFNNEADIDTSPRALSFATGMAGGGGDDTIDNASSITVQANPFAEGLVVDLGLFGIARATGSIRAEGYAVGIDGGTGKDTITNHFDSFITVTADPTVILASGTGTLTFIPLIPVFFSGAEVGSELVASAIGIQGGEGNDTIKNNGTITATAKPFVVDAGLQIDIGISSSKKGGNGDSSAAISSSAAALDVAASAALTPIPGATVFKGNTARLSSATGIASGSGDDTLTNNHVIDVDADATIIKVDAEVGFGVDIGVSASALAPLASATSAGSPGVVSQADVAPSLTIENTVVIEAKTDVDAMATGIDAGSGNDTINNKGTITVTPDVEMTNVAATAKIEIPGPPFLDLALFAIKTDASTTMNVDGIGIAGGVGNDTITNHTGKSITATSHATATSVSATLNPVNVLIPVPVPIPIIDFLQDPYAQADADISASAIGIHGDIPGLIPAGTSGQDTIMNNGTVKAEAFANARGWTVTALLGGGALGSAAVDADSTATGIDGGIDNDTITNTGTIESTADARSTGVSIQASLILGADIGKVSSDLAAVSTGIQGGTGNDTIRHEETGTITANAISDADVTSVDATLGPGAVIASASSTSRAGAAGIEGGLGNDDIQTHGKVMSEASATLNARAISFILLSTGFSDFPLPQGAKAESAGATAEASATGIDGGFGIDIIKWYDEIDVDAVSHADAVLVATAGTGATVNEATIVSSAHALGVAGGAGDDDIDGFGKVYADATATSGSVSVTVSGLTGPDGASVNTGTNLTAMATGVDGGLGNDTIDIQDDVRAAACANSGPDAMDDDCPPAEHADPLIGATGVSVSLIDPVDGGKVVMTTVTNATATAVTGGGGIDHIINKGMLTAVADTEARSTSVVVSGIGTSDGTLTTTMAATATGMHGDSGNDWLEVRNPIEVTANTTAATTSVNVTVGGTARIDAETKVTASAHGINGGPGNDIIDITDAVSAISHATTTDEGWSVVLFGSGSQGADLTVDAFSAGVLGGAGIDHMTNSAAFTIFSTASGTSKDVNVNLLGATRGEAGMAVNAALTGMQGDAGADVIMNSGNITGDAKSDATFSSVDFSLGGTATSSLGNADSVADTLAAGLTGDSGDDWIENDGLIFIDTTATVATTAGSTITVFGIAGTSATLAARPTGIGIDGGADNDVIKNLSLIDVGSHAVANLISGSAFSFIGKASDTAEVGGHAAATGITGGSGTDMIDNTGTVRVLADSTMDVGSGTTVVFGEARSTSHEAVTASAVGIAGAEEADWIINQSIIDAIASLVIDSKDTAYAFVGDPTANPTLSANSTSTGIAAGEGDDRISNEADATITVKAEAMPSTSGDSRATFKFGTVSGSATLDTVVAASGIGAGAGNDSLLNPGGISVIADSDTSATNTSHAGIFLGDTDSTATASATIQAWGMDAGDGDNDVHNSGVIHGSLTVFGIEPEDGPTVLANSEALGGDVTVTSDANATATATLSAELFGLAGSGGANTIINTGSITLQNAPEVKAVAVADGDGFDGDGSGEASVWVGSNDPADIINPARKLAAIGMEAGDGNNTLINRGELDISASPVGTATANVDGDLFGSAVATMNSTVHAHAAGIRAGDGINVIINEKDITVSSDVTAEVVIVAGSPAGRGAEALSGSIGIRAGNGGNEVYNSGFIDVLADATATAPGSLSAIADATAIAIQTGGGDDRIMNAKAGVLQTTVKGVVGDGTGIDAGGGNDVVQLLDTSAVTGSVLLGDGDDVIAFRDDATASGKIKGGSGQDTLRLDDQRKLDLLSGNLSSIERFEANQGTVAAEGDYTLLDGGGFQVELYEGGHGQLAVNGAAAIGVRSDIKVIASRRIYFAGDIFDVLVGDTVAGTFATEDLTSSRFLNFTVNYLPAEVQIAASVLPFGAAARNRVQRAVGGYLDQITPAATGDMAGIIGAFQLLSHEVELDAAFRSLSPDTHDNYTRTSYDAVTQYQDVLDRRIRERRGGGLLPGTALQAGGFGTGAPLLLAYNGPVADVGPMHADDAIAIPAWWRDFWGTAFGRWGDQDGENGYTGFDYDVLGLAMGFDRNVNEHLMLGVSAAYTDTDVDMDKGMGHGDVDGWIASVYGNYSLERAYVDATLSYGQNDYDARRNLRVGMINRTARSDHDGDVVAASLGSGYPISRGETVLEPFGRLQYVRLDEDGFTESGAGSANQQISSRDTDSLTSEIGMRVSRVFQKANGQLTAGASVAWLHDFDIDDRVITTGYTGAPASSFSLPGQDVERNGATLGLGVGFETSKGVSTSLNYNGEFRDGFSAHGIVGQISYRF